MLIWGCGGPGRNLRVVLLIALAVYLRAVNVFAADVSVQESQVDSLFSSWNNQTSPGCAVAVMKDGHIAYEHGYGMADLGHNVKITPATVFYVGSMSKQFTATATLMLVDDGRISLDDPIRKYVPEVPDFGRLRCTRCWRTPADFATTKSCFGLTDGGSTVPTCSLTPMSCTSFLVRRN